MNLRLTCFVGHYEVIVYIEINKVDDGCKIKTYIYLYFNVIFNEVPRSQVAEKGFKTHNMNSWKYP